MLEPAWSLIRSKVGTAKFFKTDVSDEKKSVQALADTAFNAFGQVDILVNNVAAEPIGSILELPIKEWDRAYAANLRGAVLGIKAFLPGC
jgi:NAD(P)-dependent dehydrogenase (short-subunit alcohol dehydrogenase family)